MRPFDRIEVLENRVAILSTDDGSSLLGLSDAVVAALFQQVTATKPDHQLRLLGTYSPVTVVT